MAIEKYHSGDEVRITAKDSHDCGSIGKLEARFVESRTHWYVRTAGGRGIYPDTAFKLVLRCPWRLAIRTLVGKEPPEFVRGDLKTLTDDQHEELQNWIGENLQPAMEWSTAIGVIDAACLLVELARDNANFRVYYSGYGVD